MNNRGQFINALLDELGSNYPHATASIKDWREKTPLPTWLHLIDTPFTPEWAENFLQSLAEKAYPLGVPAIRSEQTRFKVHCLQPLATA